MPFEAQLFAIRRMAAEIRTEAIKLDNAFLPKPGSHAYESLSRKLADWQMRALAMERRLLSQSGLLDVSYRPYLRGPGSYATRQSYASRQGNVATLRGEVEEVLAAIAELAAKLDGPEDERRAIVKAVEHAIKNLTKAGKGGPGSERGATQGVVEVLGPSEVPPLLKPGMTSGVMTACALLLVALHKLLTKKRD
ncbi:MAG: hypothetical protein AAFY59_06670 [Pseudomonadota bacterium]